MFVPIAALTLSVPWMLKNQQLSPLEFNFAPLSQVVPTLAAQYQLEGSVVSELADVPVFVRIDPSSLSATEAFAAIADATGCTFTISQNKVRLTIDSQLKTQQSKEVNAKRVAQYTRMLSTLKLRVDQLKPITEESAKKEQEARLKQMQDSTRNMDIANMSMNFMSFMPGSEGASQRLGYELLSKLGAEALTSLDDGRRVVFSTKANAMQLPLPGSVLGAFRRFIKEQLITQTAQASGQSGTGRAFDFGQNSAAKGDPNDFNLGLISLQVNPITRLLQLEIIAADSKGRSIVSGILNLTVGQTSPVAPATDQPIAVSPLAKEMASLLGITAQGNGVRMVRLAIRAGSGGMSIPNLAPPKTVSNPMRNFLSDLSKNELWSLYGQDVLKKSESNKNLIAAFPDSQYPTLIGDLANEKISLKSIWSNIEANDFISVRRSEKLTLVMPINGAVAREHRLNRRAFAPLLARAFATGLTPLDEVTAFADAQKYFLAAGRLAEPLLDAATSIEDGRAGLATREGFEFLRFVHLLSPEARRALNSGQPITLSRLLGESSNLLASVLFNGSTGPFYNDPTPPNTSPNMPREVRQAMGGLRAFLGQKQVRDERTMLLPNGLSGNAVVTMKLSSNSGYYAVDSRTGAKALGGPEIVGMSGMARLLNGGQGPEVSYDRFRAATRSSFEFSFKLAPNVEFNQSLSDARIDANAQDLAYNQLPAEWRKQAEEMKRGMANVNFTPGGRRINP